MSLILDGTSGASLVQPAVITQAALAPNVVGNGPCFSAYQNAVTSLVSGTYTKILFQVMEFDTNSNYSGSRFTPTLAGYYLINGSVSLATASSSVFASIYKNGSMYKRGQQSGNGTNSAYSSVFSILVYLNGSTDYVEVYAVHGSGATINTTAIAETTYFQANLVRSA